MQKVSSANLQNTYTIHKVDRGDNKMICEFFGKWRVTYANEVKSCSSKFPTALSTVNTFDPISFSFVETPP